MNQIKIELPFDRADSSAACSNSAPKCTQEDWGPAMWLYLHRSALAEDPIIPPERQAHISRFLKSLPDVLPSTESCGCGDHFRNLLEIMPPALHTRSAYFAWTVDAHNYVNHRLDKRIVPLDEAIQLTRKPIRVGTDTCPQNITSPTPWLQYIAVAAVASVATYGVIHYVGSRKSWPEQ